MSKPRYRAYPDPKTGGSIFEQVVTVDDLPPASASMQGNVRPTNISGLAGSPAQYSIFDGDKFPGGFGPTELWLKDYWTLRQRSAQLFENNLYARGMIRRLVTNVINTGLTLEAFPEEALLGFSDGDLDDWSEDTENRFRLWCSSPFLCDYYGMSTFYQLQAEAYREALISGDVLIIMRQDERTKLPKIQLVSGDRVRSPMNRVPRKGQNKIYHGVEIDSNGRQVAYHITREGDEPERIPAYGPRTGRRIAWLQYGTDRRSQAVRGDPLLSIVMQSLRELDRYRDSAQRKAVINSVLAMFISKNSDKPGTMPLSGGATRRDQVVDRTTGTEPRRFDIEGQIPGLTLQELQEGERPEAFGHNGTDINFPVFESAIVHAMAWSFEVPAEIMTLAFQNNYSASQAAINEFKMFLNRVRQDVGKGICQPVYADWLLSQVLLQRLDAPGFLDAWRDPMRHETYAAWLQSDWTGAIKPSTDLVKQARGQGMLLDRGLTTHSRAAAEITGMSFNRIVKRLRRENEQLIFAQGPVREAQEAASGGGDDDLRTRLDYLVDVVDGLSEANET